MLKEELTKRKSELEKEVAGLELKLKPLEENLRKKREALQHVVRLIDLEDGGAVEPNPSELVASRVTRLLPSDGGTPSSSVAGWLPIFARYKGERYEAQLDRSRISGGRGHCMLFRGKWVMASAAAGSISGTMVNGWRFWRYLRPDGTPGLIDELRGK